VCVVLQGRGRESSKAGNVEEEEGEKRSDVGCVEEEEGEKRSDVGCVEEKEAQIRARNIQLHWYHDVILSPGFWGQHQGADETLLEPIEARML
jgi:hypothetical protein